jgi:hypothetical protein
MLRATLFRGLNKSAGRNRLDRRWSFVPRLDVLEDRTLPSTLTVLNLSDTGVAGDGSLRGEIAAAQWGDTINFNPGLSGTITLSGSELFLNKNLTITGPGASQIGISGNNAVRILEVASGATVSVTGLTIENGSFRTFGPAGAGIANEGTLTLTNCSVANNRANGLESAWGGGIVNKGSLTIQNSLVMGNVCATTGGGGGGAIDNYSTLAIVNSTLSNNNGGGGEGGAILNETGATATITSSTLSGNKGTSSGGISNYGTMTIDSSTLSGNTSGFSAGGIYNAGTLTLSDSTIAANSAYSGGGGILNGGTLTINNSTIAGNANSLGSFGGGIYNGGALNMQNTILAGNTDTGGAPDLYGSLTSSGYNLIGNTAGSSGGFAATDLLNVNPRLGPLQNNGGPTQTMALLSGSPALDAGDPNYLTDTTNPLAYDQRGPGFNRVANGRIDIGAFEAQTSVQPPANADHFAVSGFPGTVTAGASGSFTVTALFADGTTDAGYVGIVHFTSSDPHAVLPADYTFTSADAGTHTFSAVLETAGSQSLTAADRVFASISGTETGITVNPAVAVARRLSLTGPTTVAAGARFNLTVTALDAYGNVATGYRGTIRITATNGKGNLPATYAFTAADKGVHTFVGVVFQWRGKHTIIVTDTLNSSIVGSLTVNIV